MLRIKVYNIIFDKGTEGKGKLESLNEPVYIDVDESEAENYEDEVDCIDDKLADVVGGMYIPLEYSYEFVGEKL